MIPMVSVEFKTIYAMKRIKLNIVESQGGLKLYIHTIYD